MSLSEQLRNYDGAIIVIKSLARHGDHIDAYHKHEEGWVTKWDDDEVMLRNQLKFKLHVLDANKHLVCFKSERWAQDYYLDCKKDKIHMRDAKYISDPTMGATHDVHHVGTGRSTIIPDHSAVLNWAVFKLHGTDISNVAIQSTKYTDRWLSVVELGIPDIPWQGKKRRLGAQRGDRNQAPTKKEFRFKIDTPAEPEVIWDSSKSVGCGYSASEPKDYSFTHEVEVKVEKSATQTSTRSWGVEASLGIVAKQVSASLGGNFQTTEELSQTVSNTHTESNSVTNSGSVNPGRKVTVNQLVIKYGDHITFKTFHFVITEEDLPKPKRPDLKGGDKIIPFEG